MISKANLNLFICNYLLVILFYDKINALNVNKWRIIKLRTILLYTIKKLEIHCNLIAEMTNILIKIKNSNLYIYNNIIWHKNILQT